MSERSKTEQDIEKQNMEHSIPEQPKTKTGKVWLVGAGPGDIGLLTLKGREVMEHADVIIYDALVGKSILSVLPSSARLINAGKRSGHHTLPQEQMNELLLKEAQAGHQVVRLKGGDPFVFGRGGEELELLAQNNIPYEVIPGVTSAFAVPAYNGIPVTHRDFTSSVHVITGHKRKGSEYDIDFEALVRTEGTLIFLMGLAALPDLMNGLIEGGMDPAMPAAVLERGTTARQRRVVGTVGTLALEAAKADIQPPAITVVGRVALLADQFAWYERLPLFGLRILITRPRELSSQMAALLRREGAEVLELPAIETVSRVMKEPPDTEAASRAMNEPQNTEAVSRVTKEPPDTEAASRMDTEPSAKEPSVTIPPEHESDRAASPAAAHDSGWKADSTSGRWPGPASHCRPEHESDPEDLRGRALRAIASAGDYDWLVFTSPTGVRIFMEAYLEDHDIRALSSVKIAVIGEGSRRALQSYGLRADFMPSVYDGETLGRELAPQLEEGMRVLIPRAALGSQALIRELQTVPGLIISDVATYDTKYTAPAAIDERTALENGDIDYVVFTSASTVKGLHAAVGDIDYSHVKAVCIGKQTRAAADRLGMKTWMSEKATMPSIVDKLKEVAAQARQKEVK